MDLSSSFWHPVSSLLRATSAAPSVELSLRRPGADDRPARPCAGSAQARPTTTRKAIGALPARRTDTLDSDSPQRRRPFWLLTWSGRRDSNPTTIPPYLVRYQTRHARRSRSLQLGLREPGRGRFPSRATSIRRSSAGSPQLVLGLTRHRSISSAGRLALEERVVDPRRSASRRVSLGQRERGVDRDALATPGRIARSPPTSVRPQLVSELMLRESLEPPWRSVADARRACEGIGFPPRRSHRVISAGLGHSRPSVVTEPRHPCARRIATTFLIAAAHSRHASRCV